jgi:cell division protease FtsH
MNKESKPDSSSQNKQTESDGSPIKNTNYLVPLLILAGLLVFLVVNFQNNKQSTISYGYFQKLIKGQDFNGKPILGDDGEPIMPLIENVTLTPEGATGLFTVIPDPEPTYKDGKLTQPDPSVKLQQRFRVELPDNERTRDRISTELENAGVKSISSAQPSNFLDVLGTILMFALIGSLLYMFLFLRRSQNQMMGGGGFLSNFSKSPAKKYESMEQPITFKDVAGLENVKADLGEIVDFLRDPSKFQRLGGRVPKGALLIGPPGTGKTLLARAVAGEAEVPYFSVNGSEFIQMFVGVGASRVRDLFATAKAQSPAIIFIDEIDAVGRQRGAGLGGGHDEREQTLNQILGEMDGFQGSDSVIILAATNRPDILDPALLRPGRFDRHVTVSRPTKTGRLAIFKVHVREVPLGPDVKLEVMAQATAGMTGADIKNLVNEAALWAARKNKTKVEMEDFYYAHDKVLMGAAREEVLTAKEKERTAYHEAGHTIAAWFLEGASPVHKVTVIPRGQALGVTQMVHDEDRMNMSEQELRDNLVVLLAGRAAEQIIYDELTVGAENDLERATSMARRMVTHWGMSDRLGPVSYKMTDDDPFLGREMHKSRQFSEHTMEVIDEEVHLILEAAAKSAIELLEKHRDNLQAITDGLVEQEELDRHQIADLIGPSVHTEREAELPPRREKSGDSESSDSNPEADASETNGVKSDSSGNNGSATDGSKDSASQSAAK